MANLRFSRHLQTSQRGRLETSEPVRSPVRRWPWVAGVLAVALLALAWFDGGERSLRPIAEEVTLPEQAQ